MHDRPEPGGPSAGHELLTALAETEEAARRGREEQRADPTVVETGTVESVEKGVVRVRGLSGAATDEVLRFPGDVLGLVFDLEPDRIGTVLLDSEERVEAGDEVRRTGRVFGVPVGDALLGRVVDATGRPVDGGGPLLAAGRLPAEREAPELTRRAPVHEPLQTGIKVVDALVPVGRGQRELILGDRQTGKTTLAVETMVNPGGDDLVCVYCAVGQRDVAVSRVVDRLRRTGTLERTIVVVASGDEAPGLQYVAPYAATSMAEHFMEDGRDVLVVYDDLTRHARAYRELSLLLRRPPGREAFPGDVFHLHARLLERATRLSDDEGGGSLTALPIAETEAQNLAAYIPTNLISITDGQIYLSPRLFGKGVLPAVDVERSVSRVGGQAQLPAYHAVAGDLRLSYAQFLELEVFSRFGTRMDPETRRALERGRRVREVLKQPVGRHLPAAEQVAVLLAAVEGALDTIPEEEVEDAERRIREGARDLAAGLCGKIEAGERLTPSEWTELRRIVRGLAEGSAADRGESEAGGGGEP